jgi:hypothetical protein
MEPGHYNRVRSNGANRACNTYVRTRRFGFIQSKKILFTPKRLLRQIQVPESSRKALQKAARVSK